MLDTKALAEATAAIVREHVTAATAPLIAENKALRDRLDALESAQPANLPDFDAMIAAKFAEIPTPKDGEPGKDGKDADESAVAQLVDAAVAKALADRPELELPDFDQIIDEKVTAIPLAKDGEPGQDGAGISDLLIDLDGNLVATFTDGRLKTLGRVIGKDGIDGKDGEPGTTFTLDDFDIEQYPDGRTFKFMFTRDGVCHSFEFAFPIVLDRGVWKEGAYEAGDAVTWAGSLWIAQRDTSAKPDTADSGWRLAVKKGRDGKDFKG